MTDFEEAEKYSFGEGNILARLAIWCPKTSAALFEPWLELNSLATSYMVCFELPESRHRHQYVRNGTDSSTGDARAGTGGGNGFRCDVNLDLGRNFPILQ